MLITFSIRDVTCFGIGENKPTIELFVEYFEKGSRYVVTALWIKRILVSALSSKRVGFNFRIKLTKVFAVATIASVSRTARTVMRLSFSLARPRCMLLVLWHIALFSSIVLQFDRNPITFSGRPPLKLAIRTV